MNRLMKIFLGLALSSLAAGIVLIPSVALPQAVSDSEPIEVSVQPNPLRLSCPGAFVELGGESGVELGNTERIGEASIASKTPEGFVLGSPLTSNFKSFQVGDSDQSTSLLSATQTQYVERERARGLMATFCEQPTTSGWFIAGQSGVGRETVLLMSNPNPVDTQILVRFHTPGGVLEERLALGAEEETAMGLAAQVGPESVYAIEFSSLGAPVAAALQHRFSRGLTPLGLSLSMSSRAPATDQWITPIEVFAEGYENPLLRLYAPDGRAEVIGTLFSDSGPELIRTVVPEAGFVELPLDLANGVYALKLESDQPVLAGVLNPALEPLDYSWLSASELFASVSLAIPNYRSELVLTNPNAVAVSVRVTQLQSGRESFQTVQLGPLSVLKLPVTGDYLTAVSANQFFAALQLTDPLGYAVVNPSENANPGSEISILVR